ncbi:hypothetical protein [Nonomuraea sp. SYSU D8015]|uniref:hypothetical protein n=1 Tax=Nonomuraea sp. SYSU D8015 TaxID=2593644 RepID=UPI001660226B|nr:hypothetical protein [Nonomuraea sp. SYSU D8015]
MIFQVSNPKIAAGVALVSPSSPTSPGLVSCLDQLADLALWEGSRTGRRPSRGVIGADAPIGDGPGSTLDVRAAPSAGGHLDLDRVRLVVGSDSIAAI